MYIVASVDSAVLKIISEIRERRVMKRIPAKLGDGSNQFGLVIPFRKMGDQF